MKKIPLTQGKFALVDDRDYGELSRYKWYAHRMGNRFYAVRRRAVSGRNACESMHRKILGLRFGDGKFTDHIDNDSLNNQRSNLRICTRKENCRNQKKPKNNTSGFKGVTWHKYHKKWMSSIMVNSRTICLGYFQSPIVAALAYNEGAIEHFGEFAKLNRIEGRM